MRWIRGKRFKKLRGFKRKLRALKSPRGWMTQHVYRYRTDAPRELIEVKQVRIPLIYERTRDGKLREVT